jgi:hypothetical protein
MCHSGALHHRGRWCDRVEAVDLKLARQNQGSYGSPSASIEPGLGHVKGDCSGTLMPIPLWRVTLRGTDDAGRRVRTVIDVHLPADPPLVSQ